MKTFTWLITFAFLLYACTNQEAEQKKSEQNDFKGSWKNYVSVDNIYGTVNKTWGGVKNLLYTVKNTSDYHIDKLVFEVVYIKKNGIEYKREQVIVEDVAPHSSRNVTAPDSPRGMSVQHSIVKIKSTQADLY